MSKDSQDWLDDLELRIGFLRQWLNEDRITDGKLVTNEEIKHWLGYDKQAIKAHIKQEMLKLMEGIEITRPGNVVILDGNYHEMTVMLDGFKAELRKAIEDNYKED